MSFESLAIAMNHSRSTGTARLVLLGIANHDGDGGAWPSRDTLAKYAGITDHGAVRKAVNRLVALNEVRRHENAGGSPDVPDYLRPNRYDFLLRCPEWCDRSSQHRDTRKAARYVPRWLDVPDPADSHPPDPADSHPPDPADSHPPKPVIKKPATRTSALDLNAGAREAESCPGTGRPHRLRSDGFCADCWHRPGQIVASA
jgi:hypothetical protein